MNKEINLKGHTSSFSDFSSSLYSRDAWGRNKSIIDTSILHGMFTYGVPVDKWIETHSGAEQSSFSYASSIDGELIFNSSQSLDESIVLKTMRNPRYQPNRGHLYSSSIFLRDSSFSGVRRFGYFTEESGSFFELTNLGLFAVVRTTIGGTTTDDRKKIDIPVGVNIENGNVYDIQMQWRGVGNYTFYINLQPVAKFDYLGNSQNLSIFNPANPISFECINKGDTVSIGCGCVDISSEGGDQKGGAYGSIGLNNNSGQISIPGSSNYNNPIIAVRSKKTVNGRLNTRDTLALLASAYSDERSILRVWATRDFSAISSNDQNWSDYGDGHLEKIVYDDPDVLLPMSFDTSKANIIFTCRVGQDETYSTSALFEGRADIYITPGDMLVFTMHKENGQAINTGVTFEFSEEI